VDELFPDAPPLTVDKMILNTEVPFAIRKKLLSRLIKNKGDEAQALLLRILDAAAGSGSETKYQEKQAELDAIIKQLQDGPLRNGSFVRLYQAPGSGRRAEVRLPDGATTFSVVLDDDLADELECGDEVILDAQCRMLLGRAPESLAIGEEARLERRIDRDRVEVEINGQGKFVFQAGAGLVRDLDAGAVRQGGGVLVCDQRMMAYAGVPRSDEYRDYRYLVRGPVPDVVVERDIGAPPAFIEEFVVHARREILDPGYHRQYRRPAAKSAFLTGITGSGKTLSVLGLWRRLYDLMSEVTKVAIEDLPPRVFRLRPSRILSKWVGEPQRNIDRFFDQLEQFASEPWVAPDGKRYRLPTLMICEEADSLARTRGSDPIHDRIQNALLDRLDATSQVLRDRLVLMCFTSNLAHLVDSAFQRRVGATTVYFGRLDRRSFALVLAKQLHGLPFRTQDGESNDDAERRVVSRLASWLFCKNDEQPQVEISLMGAAGGEMRYRRDFLTGALVARAVEQASQWACDDAYEGRAHGITAEVLMRAMSDQVRTVVEQLAVDNVRDYVALPDGTRVSAVRRIEQPEALPVELLAAS